MAKKMVNFLNDDGSTVAIETNAPDTTADVPTEPRLRKVPGKVTDNGLLVIERAVMLHQSTRSVWSNEPEDVGITITSICAEWMTSEQARLSGKGQPMKGVN
jgi:hypothetical protein